MADNSPARPLTLTRGEISRRAGCNGETVRYYEKIGLLAEPRRSAGGHRLYGEPELKRLTFIRRSRELGFSLDEIRGLLVLVDGGSDVCAEIKALTLDHAADIRRRVADLRRMERVLTDMARRCDQGEVPDCPIVEALFDERAET